MIIPKLMHRSEVATLSRLKILSRGQSYSEYTLTLRTVSSLVMYV